MSVTIRPAQPGDAAFLSELLNDEDTKPFLSVRGDEDHHRRMIVELDGEPAGTVRYRQSSERHRIVEVGGFAIHPRFRGRRLGDEAARVFQRLLLVELGFHRIELQIYGFNERAIAHAERSGFVREGVKRKAYLREGVWQDAVQFALVREDLD